MNQWKALYRQSRDGLLMQDGDLGELYSYLELFRNTYITCEKEADRMLLAIQEIYMLQTGIRESMEALKNLRNPRNSGRKKTITEEQAGAVQELRCQGMTIREIAENTGLSKSSVQRILKKELSHN